jgi:two-component system, response regulator PdtaR
MEEMLTALGYDVVGQAESAMEAIDMARELNLDLILMDVVMPGKMNGMEAAAKIKEELDIPIIFISGCGDSEHVEKAKKVQPYGYVMKPFDENQIRLYKGGEAFFANDILIKRPQVSKLLGQY